jgi:phosphatidylinositol glycan class F
MMSVLVFGLLILFGAPATILVSETYLCAVHIALLSVQPLVFVYSLDSNIWKDIVSVKLPLNGVYGASIGTWVGAWLGAVPIPLDWDRPWQRWPVTILTGAYMGAAVGAVVGAVCKQARINPNNKI